MIFVYQHCVSFYMTMRDSAAPTRRVSEDASLTLRVCAAESCTVI
jgi:hypothetical protein